jgi:hypothetical protein
MKYVTFISLLFLCLIGTSCSAQGIKGNGKVTSETRQVGEFHSLQIKGACDVYIAQGRSSSVMLKTDENLQEVISTVVEDGVLVVDNEKSIRKSTMVELRLSAENLRQIEILGAAKIVTEDPLRGSKLVLKISGAVEGALDLNLDELETQCSGAGSLKLVGRANRASYQIDGAASIKAFDLSCDDLSLAISGTGSAQVNAAHTLDVEVSGMASVRYKGSPEVKKQISGMGSVKKD